MIEWPLQQAIYTVLNAAPLGVVRVLETAPQGADGGDTSAFPYITMGRSVITERDTQTKVGFAAQIRIHTHSRTGEMSQCKIIQGKIFEALHRVEMTVAGFNNFSLLREDTDCRDGKDGKIYGVCEYRALIETS